MKPTSMRLRLLVLFVLLASTVAAFAQHANIKRGFSVDSAFQTGDVDSVNMFNGNVIVRVPIGQRYNVGANMSYQFGLTHNSKAWDYEPSLGLVRVNPSHRSNAGMGWLLSFGRILHPDHPSNDANNWIYESPDGGEHAFYCRMHEDEFPANNCESLRHIGVQGYSRDGTYLRMRNTSTSTAAIDFPDGSTHYFEDDGHNDNLWLRITKMTDRFGNWVEFKYPTKLKWEITDSQGRAHTVTFEPPDGTLPTQFNYQTRIQSIEVAKWKTGTAKYELEYDEQQVGRPCIPSNFTLNPPNGEPTVSVLKTIKIPTGSTSENQTWTFSYFSSKGNCSSGGISKLKMPTGATIDYTYQEYELPAEGCTATSALNVTGGILQRKVTDVARGGTQYIWDYTTALEGTDNWNACGTLSPIRPAKVLKNTVKLQNREKVTHYFSVWPKSVPSGGYKREDYGLPFSRQENSGGRFLSTITSDQNGFNDKIKTYVNYEMDPWSFEDNTEPTARDANRRVSGTRTVYLDDNNKFVDVAYDDFDALGHYRSVTTSSNFDTTNQKPRTVFTNYNPGKKLNPRERPPSGGEFPGFWPPTIPHGGDWLLETYTERKVTEENQPTLLTQVCFDGNGFLYGRRTVKGTSGQTGSTVPTPSSNDLLAVFGHDSTGNLNSEKYYGGDDKPTSSSGCTPGTNAQTYELAHEFQYGTLKKSQYVGSGFFTVFNEEIDQRTGLVNKSKDTSEVLVTVYEYDNLGRVKTITPPSGHGPKFTYEYGLIGGTSPTVNVTADVGSTEIDRKYIRFDSLGRPWREYKLMPGARDNNGWPWSVRQFVYDAYNRPTEVSQPEEMRFSNDPSTNTAPKATNVRKTSYDHMGRPLVITSPDSTSHDVSYKYTGVTQAEETVRRGGTNGERPTTVQRFYDQFGRLISVKENSRGTSDTDPSGDSVTTTYEYDSGDRLVEVQMNGEQTQKRTFTYDRRGFLTKENHPETGNTGNDTVYSDHDSRGHALQRVAGGKTLTFEYDPAERLEKVNDSAGVLKQFTFATANPNNANLRKGKLETAMRRNNLPTAGEFKVTETYTYGGAAGQMSNRATTVARGNTTIQKFSFGLSYDNFLLPSTLTMPKCTENGCTSATTEDGLSTVSFKRTNGLLTSVDGFADLTYHPSGMVETVKHATPSQPVDTYAEQHGLARPSKITFSSCGQTKPTFYQDETRVRPRVIKTTNPDGTETITCGLHVTWAPATVCGSSANMRYTITRTDGASLPTSSCLEAPEYYDRSAKPGIEYTYRIVAYGPNSAGQPSCTLATRSEETRESEPTKFAACAAETILLPNPVTASIGVPAHFTATLSSANGFIEGEPIVFKVNNKVLGIALTGPSGFAQLNAVVDLDPGTYPLTVGYYGFLLPTREVVVNLTAVCDKKSYSIHPLRMNVRPEGSPPGNPFDVSVAASDRCAWNPIPDPGFLSVADINKTKGTFGIVVPTNPTNNDRQGDVNVGFQDVVVKQSGTGCEFSFNTDVAYLPAETGGQFGTGALQVFASQECASSVSVESVGNWLSIEEPEPDDMPKNGSYQVNYRIFENPTEQKRVGYIVLKQNGVEKARAAVNQRAQPKAQCPIIILENLQGGSVDQYGQNIPLRIHTTGTRLKYIWYVDNVPLPTCEGSSCANFLLDSDGGRYPDPTKSVSIQVKVFNTCGEVTSQRVMWHNNAPPSSTCRVPVIQSTLMRENDAPREIFSPRPGATVGFSVIGLNLSGPHSDLKYQWYHGIPPNKDGKVANGTGDSISVNPFGTSFYWLELTNACGSQMSRSGAVFITEPEGGRRRACCRFDLNNDGHSDVPWRNVLTGQNELWLMNGTTHSTTVALPTINSTTTQLQSIGDLDADENPDILFRNTATGENQVWLMNHTTRRGAINLESRPGGEWSMGAVADYDQDGHDDIVWHNNATGANELWFQESTEHAGSWALPKSGNSGLYGTGDFNNDDLPDLFFHDRATGQNAIWMMNDDGTRGTIALKEAGSGGLKKRSVTTKIVATNSMSDPGFAPALIADMNRDGRPDVFWRNPDTGEHKVWLMNGTAMTSTVTVEPRNEPGWEIGGGGSNNAGPQTPGGGGPVGSGPTTLTLAAETASVGKAAVVTATLLAAGQPVPDAQLVFSLNGSEVTRLLTGTDGMATAVVDVAGLAAGTYPNALGVNFPGNANFGASSATANLIVTAPAAVVSWLNPAAIVYGTPLSAAQLNATSPVPGTFVYTPAAGAILDAGYQTLSVTFTPSDPSVTPITREAVLVVQKAPSSVTWATPAEIVYGAPLSAAQLRATSTLAGTFTYTPGAGALLPVGTNTLSVLFEPDSPNYEPSSTTTTILVEKGTQRIVWDDPAPITVLVPLGAEQLNAAVFPSGTAPAGAVTYNPPLGTMLPQGVHELRVSVAATDSYDAASASVDIIVDNVRSTLTWSDPAPIVYGTPLSALQLNATADVPGTFVYDPPAGTYLRAGTEQLSVVFTPADARYEPAAMSVSLDILKGQQTLAWSKPATIVYGTALSATQLNATVSVTGPASAATLVYEPAEGAVLPAGAQLLRVTAPATDNYNSATMTVVLDVLKATPVVTWAAPAPIVYRTPLSATQLNATASVPGSFAYTPAAGTVLQAGNGQTLSVRFTPTDTSNYNSVDASTTIDVLRADPILTWATPASIVYRTPLSATQLNATADVPGTFVYTPAAGTVLQAGAGQTLSVQFTPSDTRNFNNASATTTIEVVKANPILTWPTPATIVYRTALGPTQLNATADVPGTFVYTPPAGTVLQAGAGQTLSVHFTPSDTRNFNDADASTTIEVIKATPILTWQAPAGIVYGTPLGDTQLSATADVPGTFDYTPPAGTILDAGTGHTLALHFTPEDTHNFNTVDTTRTIDVAKAKQTLSWTPPAPIVYGTPLSVAQLNATVQVVGPSPAGALTYTPAAGIVLDAGLGQTLTVNAAETKNYEPATLSVALDVLRKALSLTVDPKSKLYGGIVPPLTGTLLGVVNNDPITPSYSTTGTVQSPAGVYPINGALVDPNNRLFNYDVTITPSTLTVLPAPLTIAADPKSKQYSDPLPLLTPTYTGFVLGETPAVLSGTLVIQTTAAVLSAPGPYAITIGGLSSPNYAITYIGSTLTVLPEDARVINTSPLALSTAASGATTVTLTATVQDISATADAAGDTFPGDIRNATLTFVDRATNATLCVAPIGLVSSSDERTGIATCNFTRDFGATLPATLVIGSKIGSHYIRDAAADDVTLTVSAQSPDRVVGGGVTAFASAAGTHAPDLNEAAQFEYQFSYDRDGAVSTNLRLSFQRTEGGVKHNYLLTVDSATSLSTARTTNGGTAIVVGKGTLVDSTDKETIVTGVPMILTLTDVGNGNKTEVDAFGVTLLKPEGGVVFAAGWSGVRTTEQPIRSGQVSVNFSGK